MKEFDSFSIADTNKIARQVAQNLKGGDILALSGNLGAGKTVFVKELAKYFGIKENITSPTFVLMKVYKTDHKQIKKLVHVDCYRLEKKEDLSEIGLSDYINDDSALLVIEWADKISNLPKQSIKVEIKYINDKQRKIILKD